MFPGNILFLDIFTIPDALRFPVAPQYLIPLLVCVIGRAIAEPVRWTIYTAQSERTPFSLYFRIFMFNGFLGYLLPIKLGLPARLALLRWKTSLDLYRITSLVAFDVALTHIYWVLLAGTTLPFLGQLEFVDWSYKTIFLGLTAIGVIVWLFVLKTHPSRADAKGIIGRVATLRMRFRKAFSELNAGIISRTIVVLLFDVIFLVGLHWALVRFIGQDLPISAIFLISVIASFVGVISLTPMGLGTYDAVIIFLLVQYSLPIDAAVATPLIYRLGTAAVAIPVGFLCGLSLGINPKQREWLNRYGGSDNSHERR
jgi:uncharacterized membrane protein YbhN (UPF0104 family)